MGIFGSSIIRDFLTSSVTVIGLIKCDGVSSFKRTSIQFSSKYFKKISQRKRIMKVIQP